MKDKLYKRIALALSAIKNCEKTGNKDWQERHDVALEKLINNFMPCGSGFDTGTKFWYDESKAEKLVFSADFHHMNQDGFYDGWTQHKVIVTPSLMHDVNIRVTGKNKNDIKEYIAEIFYSCLTMERDF